MEPVVTPRLTRVRTWDDRMEPNANVVPKIEAADYEEFRGILPVLPPAYETWTLEIAMTAGTTVNARAVTPDQFQEYTRGREAAIRDLFLCAQSLWNQDNRRSDW
jgi:hypothetical protein